MSRLSSSRRHMKASQAVLAHRIVQASVSQGETKRRIRRISPAWVVGTGVVLGVTVAFLPHRALIAAMGAVTGLAVRLLNTPLGPMAIGAVVAKRQRRGEGNDTGHDADPAAGR